MIAAPSLLQTARALIVRDVQLLWRRRGDALQPALFALEVGCKGLAEARFAA